MSLKVVEYENARRQADRPSDLISFLISKGYIDENWKVNSELFLDSGAVTGKGEEKNIYVLEERDDVY